MSSLTRMGIQGIRSFSPDEEQTIKFYKPLTLICGPNGTGKSTIIECLKYATTGILPPFIKNGQAFIFDPDLANTSEVKAGIKLLFKNRTKKLTFVSRNFKLTQKKSKKQFQALDGTLKMRDDKTKEEVMQTHRCSDLDKLVPELLGVSAAIIDNVLFCHQEEANWPLRESAELKKKFDDIFESTRYTKALVELKRAKKDASEKARDANRDVAVLAAHLDRSNRLKTDLETVKLSLEDNMDKLGEFTKQIESTRVEAAEIAKQVQQFEGSFEEIKQLGGVISERERMVERERRELGVSAEMEAYTDEDLSACLQNARQGVNENRQQIERLHDDMSALQLKRNKLAGEIERLNHERANMLGRLEEFTRQTKAHENLVAEFKRKYPKHFNHASSSSTGSSQQVEFLQEMNDCMMQVVKERRDELERVEAAGRLKYEQDSKQVNELNAKITTLEHEKKSKQALCDRLSNQLDNVRQQLFALGEDGGASDAALKEAKLRHRKSEKSLQQLLENASSTERTERIAQLNTIIAELDLRRKQMDIGIAHLESQQTAQSRLDNKTEEIVKKLKQVLTHLQATRCNDSEQDQLVRKVLDELDTLQQKPESAKKSRYSVANDDYTTARVSLPHTNIARNCSEMLRELCDLITKAVKQKRDEAAQTKANLDRVIAQSTICDGKLSQLNEEYARLQQQAREYEEKLPKHGYYSMLNEYERDIAAVGASGVEETKGQTVLRLLRGELASKLEKKHNMTHLKTFYRELMRKVERNPDQCPTCDQSCSSVSCTSLDKPVEIDLDGGRSNKLLRFEPNHSYEGAKALQLKLFYRTEKAEYATRMQDFDEEIAALEQKIAKFAQYDVDAEKMQAVELEMVRKQELKTKLELEKDSMAKDCDRFSKTLADTDFPIRNLVRHEEAVKEIFRIAKDAERMEVDLERELALLLGDNDKKLVGKDLEGLDLYTARMRAREIDETKAQRSSEIHEEMQAQQRAQQEYNTCNEEVKQCAATVAKLEKESARRIELAQESKRLAEEQNNAYNQCELVKVQISPLEEECRELEQARAGNATAQRKQIDQLRRDFELVQVDKQALNSAKEQIESALRSGTKEQLARTEVQLKTERERLAVLTEECNAAKLDLNDHEHKHRELTDLQQRFQNAAKLSKAKKELSEIIAKRQRLEQEIAQGQQGATDLKSRLKQLEDTLAQKKLRKEKLLGGREALEVRRGEIQAELMEPALRDIEKRHADKMCEAVVTNMAAKDLEKYNKALDNALMLFHAEKIEDINKRVRELWQLIYKGGDIDRVELKAERGTGVSAHTYTYRVVFRKNHTEMDMKGRCSAGQKVLASLVIRLALADTFSLNCGVLALDEPSANLDLENKKGLAEALADIIKSRKNQENFQLIVITHDEEFVDVLQAGLGTNGGPYWRLCREQDATGKYVSMIQEESGE